MNSRCRCRCGGGGLLTHPCRGLGPADAGVVGVMSSGAVIALALLACYSLMSHSPICCYCCCVTCACFSWVAVTPNATCRIPRARSPVSYSPWCMMIHIHGPRCCYCRMTVRTMVRTSHSRHRGRVALRFSGFSRPSPSGFWSCHCLRNAWGRSARGDQKGRYRSGRLGGRRA